jgi:hypothetical protein
MNDLPESGPEGRVGLDAFHWLDQPPLALDLVVSARALSTFVFGTLTRSAAFIRS